MGVLCACMLVMSVDVSLWCVCVIYVVCEGVYVQSWALTHFSRYRTYSCADNKKPKLQRVKKYRQTFRPFEIFPFNSDF